MGGKKRPRPPSPPPLPLPPGTIDDEMDVRRMLADGSLIPMGQSAPEQRQEPPARHDVIFRKLQTVRQGAAVALQEQFRPLINEAVDRMAWMAKLACSLLLVYLSIFFDEQQPLLLQRPDSALDVTFFEHLFKAVTHDNRVRFEATLQFVRCIWLHAEIAQHDPAIGQLDRALLAQEILALDEWRKQNKNKKEAGSDSSTEKKKKSPPPQQPVCPLMDSITDHPVLAEVLPSCKRLDQIIKYASKAYRTSFLMYQTSGFRAHLCTFLVHRYTVGSKKTAARWLDQHLQLQAVEEEEAGETEVGQSIEENEEDGEEEEEEEKKGERVGKLEWTTDHQDAIASRLASLTQARGGGKNDYHRITDYHCSILRELEAAAESAHAPQQQPPKLFALAPMTKFTRRFIRIDIKALRDLCRGGDFLATCPPPATLQDVFVGKAIKLDRKKHFNTTLSSTFLSNGIEVHMLWEKRVSISCPVAPVKSEAAQERAEKKQKLREASAAGEKVDRRCIKETLPSVLRNSHGPIFRRKTARLEDFTCGIFQTSSILASRDASNLHHEDLSKLPYRIKTIDPGHVYPIFSAEWDPTRQRWKRGYNLSKRQYYHQLGNTHTRKRVEARLTRAAAHRQQPARPNDPIDCILRKDQLAGRVVDHLTQLSLHSAKSGSPDRCLSALLQVNRCWHDMFAFYGSGNAARVRFSSAQRKQRLIANMIERLAPESEKDNTIIVLGSARFATSFKGTQSTPVAALIKELAKVRRVVLVDEFFTSQMCPGCNLHGVGSASSSSSCVRGASRASEANGSMMASLLSRQYPLRANGGLERKCDTAYARGYKNHLHHPTRSMASFTRTHEPARERARRLKREQQQQQPHEPSRVAYRNNRAIQGLKQCIHCGRYWSRDFAGSANIGWVFMGLWVTGDRPVHLRRHSAPTPLPPPNQHLQPPRPDAVATGR